MLIVLFWKNMVLSPGAILRRSFKNIQDVVEMVVEELIEDHIPIPKEPQEEVEVFSEPRAIVTI